MRIKRCAVRIGRPFLAFGMRFADDLAYLGAAQKGRIDEPLVGKLGQCVAIFAEML
ncbi:hypothetical protein D9M69_670260 [compost metagenome]